MSIEPLALSFFEATSDTCLVCFVKNYIPLTLRVPECPSTSAEPLRENLNH